MTDTNEKAIEGKRKYTLVKQTLGEKSNNQIGKKNTSEISTRIV